MQYDLNEKPAIYITEQSSFVPIFRGIDSTALLILHGLYLGMDSDSILGYFKTELAKDGGISLTLKDNEQIAKQIERLTAQQFPKWVGGAQQIAELSDGHISEFIQPISVQPSTPSNVYVWGELSELNIHDIVLGGHSYLLITDSQFHDGRQKLDNFFFFNSVFSHCILTYSGEPGSIFDKSNKVVDSSLILFQGANLNSNYVKEFMADFPLVKIIDQTGTPDPEKHSGYMITIE